MKQATEDRISKLPRWAQDHIHDLERKVTELERKVDAAYDTNPDETDVFLEDGMNDRPLPRHSTVVFKMTDVNKRRHQREDIRVRVDRDGMLEIMGGNTISIKPQATNLVRVRLHDV